jgi:hypothetical protein
MEWNPALKPNDLLPKSMGGTADVASSTKAVADSTKAAATPSGDSDSMWHVSFDDLLDVVNPLQHLPIVGTVYRALTHDQIKIPEKIAGDALYGGVIGLASSVADVAFEKLTGHNFGDTVLALFTSHHDGKQTAVANADQVKTEAASMQAAPTPAAPAPQPQIASTNEMALTQSLSRAGADSEVTQRALYAYRRTMGLSNQAVVSPF